MADSAAPALSTTCAEYLDRHRATLREAVESGQRGLIVAERYAAMYDGLFGALCCAADAERRSQPDAVGRVALIAVGSYGRRQVAPHSDVDVLFLCDDPGDRRVAEMAQTVLYPLWDAGVDIGHAVRGLEESLELSETDIRTSTTLLDLRHVAGDRSIVEELEVGGRERIFERQLEAFLHALEDDTASRHRRYGDSIYLLEPELKVGRGGLRDLDAILWCCKARFGVKDLAEAASRDLLTERELGDLQAATEYLWSARNRLHLWARRRNDRLTYDDQEALAEALGLRDGISRATEQLMQTHFRHARAIARVADRIGERVRRSLRPPPATIRDLGDGVLVHDGRVTLKPMDLGESPVVALRLYRHALREQLPVDSEARDAVSAAMEDRECCRILLGDPEAGSLFCKLLTRASRAPLRRGSILEELHEVGLLTAMVPELETVVGKVRQDAFHVYTVDAQAIMAVDCLRGLVRGEYAADFLVVSRAAAEMPRPLPLYLALLLQGIGTGHPADPAKHAAAVAGPVCERLGLSPEDTAHAQWLIAEQSSMYHWAMRRDITDPETIAEVAEAVQSQHRLRDLYLLTFAYLMTSNPAAMTAWNARMLEDLYNAVSDRIEGRGTGEQLEALRREAFEGIDDAERRREIEAFLGHVPERYLLANSADGIRFHSSVAERREGLFAFGATDSGVGEGTLELIICCDDRPGLLADLTAALARHRFGVDSAQLYTMRRPGRAPEALDLFHVAHANMGDSELIAFELERLQQSLEAILAGEMSAEVMLAGRSRPPMWKRGGPQIRTDVHVDNASSAQYTVIDVYTRDRPELLHVISRTMHERGLSIGLAKVNTEGQAVSDVFYVQTEAGGKLAGEGQLGELSRVLRRLISKLD
ncbi:MAG: [protein-PII] uridylyltransferase [Myxococcales bacterium]|nr:[protein-PII] uridylyltransferase [Myxococcales bacterium]